MKVQTEEKYVFKPVSNLKTLTHHTQKKKNILPVKPPLFGNSQHFHFFRLSPLPLTCVIFFPSTPHTSVTAAEIGDGLSVCVLLFVMKIGFLQMDGGIVVEKCNLEESCTEKG